MMRIVNSSGGLDANILEHVRKLLVRAMDASPPEFGIVSLIDIGVLLDQNDGCLLTHCDGNVSEVRRLLTTVLRMGR